MCTCSDLPLPVVTCSVTAGLVQVLRLSPWTSTVNHHLPTCSYCTHSKKNPAKTSWGSLDAFLPVHVCVCRFACLASWLNNRISRDFAAITYTSVCVWKNRGSAKETEQWELVYVDRHKVALGCPVPFVRTVLCQSHLVFLWAEPKVEPSPLYTPAAQLPESFLTPSLLLSYCVSHAYWSLCFLEKLLFLCRCTEYTVAVPRSIIFSCCLLGDLRNFFYYFSFTSAF